MYGHHRGRGSGCSSYNRAASLASQTSNQLSFHSSHVLFSVLFCKRSRLKVRMTKQFVVSSLAARPICPGWMDLGMSKYYGKSMVWDYNQWACIRFDGWVTFLSLGPVEVIECMENEYNFNSKATLGATSYMWQDKYKPRKPCFFNRVHTVSVGGERCVGLGVVCVHLCGVALVCMQVTRFTCVVYVSAVLLSYSVHICLCRSLAKVLKTLLFCGFMLAHPMGWMVEFDLTSCIRCNRVVVQEMSTALEHTYVHIVCLIEEYLQC